jgi:hypothetical protein
VQALHQSTMRVLSGLLADAYTARNRHAAALVRALRSAGLRSAVLPKRLVAQALEARRAHPQAPRAVVVRLLRRKLITSSAEVTARLRRDAKRAKPAKVNLLRAIARPVAITQLRAAAGMLGLADVARLLDGVQRSAGVSDELKARSGGYLGAALRCDAQSPAALERLAASITSPAGIDGDGGLLVAAAARSISAAELQTDPVCTTE